MVETGRTILKRNAMFELIIDLKNKTYPNKSIFLFDEGEEWEIGFCWKPCKLRSLADYKSLLNIDIPEELFIFYETVSNGATLFYDVKYGQWGFKLYNLEELLDQQDKWKKSFLPKNDNYLVFCELIGDNTAIAFDMTDSTPKIVEATWYDQPEQWTTIAHSLDVWLNRLIKNNGNKYWESGGTNLCIL